MMKLALKLKLGHLYKRIKELGTEFDYIITTSCDGRDVIFHSFITGEDKPFERRESLGWFFRTYEEIDGTQIKVE